MKRIHNWAWIALEVVPGDLWIVVFVKTKSANYGFIGGHCSRELHVYLCLIPCLPVHLVIPWDVTPFEADGPERNNT